MLVSVLQRIITLEHCTSLFVGLGDIEGLINHPVHISEERTISALIPFCSLGDDAAPVGKMFDGFQTPVCNLFKEKIVAGQVCYEADINQFKEEVNWVEILTKGFGFLVDTNDEYDVKKSYRKSPAPEKTKKMKKSFDIYEDSETEETFRILLRTISN